MGIVLAVCVLLLGIVGVALYQWIGQDGFRERVAQQASDALGVPVRLGRIRIDWFPVPAVALDDVALQTQPPLTARSIEARPVWSALLHKRLEVATLVVRGAVVPQAGVDAALAALQRRKPAGGAATQRPVPGEADVSARSASSGSSASSDEAAASAAAALLWIPRRTLVDGLSWTSSKGVITVLDAQAHVGDDGLPQDVTVKLLKGPFQGAGLTVTREEKDWLVDASVGGGTIKGKVSLRPASAPGREMVLSGELATRGVEVSALTAPSRPLTGKVEADTSFNARAVLASGLPDALQSETRFTVNNAVLQGLDLARAVSTIGLSRGGETAFSQLSGQVATRGRSAQLTNLLAKSGVLAARGDVAVSAAQALSGRVVVDVTAGVASGLTGIPLVVGGTVNAPEVSLSRTAMLGAAIGTAVMPGVGTGAGAKLGDSIGRGLSGLFGGKK
ncbi:hypothetical protein BH11PSE7_BH11PSE7_26670 [soil metagenome]